MPHVQRSWRAYVRCISIVFQLPDSTVGDVVQLVRTLPCHNPSVGLSLESSLRFSSNFHRQTLTHAKTARHSQYERLSILLIPLGVGRSRLLALGQVPVTNRLLQLLGSASEYLVRLSPLSVFLIPMNSTEAPAWQAGYCAKSFMLLAQNIRASSDRRISSLPCSQNCRAASRASSQTSNVCAVACGSIKWRGGTWPSAVGAYNIET